MDGWEATKVVFDRVRALDPDNASKIMGLLLIQDKSDKELIRLAFGPDHLLHAFVAAARAELAAKPASPPSPAATRPWGADHQAPGYGGGALYADDYGCCPCMYFARGYCKNGAACRFLHGLPEDDAAERDVVAMRAKALAAAAARPQPLTASAFPFSLSPPKGVSLDFLLPSQQPQPPRQQAASEAQRAAASMLLGGCGGDMHRFPARSPRLDRGGACDLMSSSPAARQIYLTFPADSTFSEEDVSSYFSMYGPVQDVRIPYQQKRMFGFVTFVYPETVKLILSKGNPHFVCDARVLVKPYKEKGKVPDRLTRKLQHPHHGDFAGCTSPTGLLDPRDPFDLQQPQIGPRMMYNHDAFLRRKLEEERQQAAELQQAIELEGRRFMGLQLLDLKSSRGGHHLGSSPMPLPLAQAAATGNGVNGDDATTEVDNKMNSSSLAMSASAPAAVSAAAAAEGKHESSSRKSMGMGMAVPSRRSTMGKRRGGNLVL
ncbi:hypothetical protein BS78_08G013600 [Paspalum vaginatum]|nr:hypothetical protein BS78_08G013600 [Paspalum vaginatum]